MDEVFDDDYWREVELHGMTCQHCGHFVKPQSWSPTGWTHAGPWVGVRCPNMISGATPAAD